MQNSTVCNCECKRGVNKVRNLLILLSLIFALIAWPCTCAMIVLALLAQETTRIPHNEVRVLSPGHSSNGLLHSSHTKHALKSLCVGMLVGVFARFCFVHPAWVVICYFQMKKASQTNTGEAMGQEVPEKMPTPGQTLGANGDGHAPRGGAKTALKRVTPLVEKSWRKRTAGSRQLAGKPRSPKRDEEKSSGTVKRKNVWELFFAREGVSSSQTENAAAVNPKRPYVKKAKVLGITVQAPTPNEEVVMLRQTLAVLREREKFFEREVRAFQDRGSLVQIPKTSPDGHVDGGSVPVTRLSRWAGRSLGTSQPATLIMVCGSIS